jgi:membrane-bound inhibitor of C-type lysozyme
MIRYLAIAALAAGTAGCASVVRGTSENVAFVSEPPGAIMTSNSKYACPATPCTLQVDRTDQFDATFAKPGYHPQTIPVRTAVSGGGAAGMAGNVLVGGLIGIGVDAATGAALDHTPNPVVANLQPISAGRGARPVRRKRAPAAAPAAPAT